MKTIKLTPIIIILLLGFISKSLIAQDCLNFANMTAPVADYNNDSIYPIGATLLNSGDLNLIKTKTGSWTAPGYFEQTTIASISSTQLFFHGYLTFDVSNASYTCKKLSVDGTAEKIIIGNDTISTAPGFNPYNGNGFVIDTLAGGGYIVTGNFNAVTIWIPTGLLNDACLENCSTNNTGCIDFRDLIGTSWPGNTGYNNDSLYPAGSTILSSGGVSIIKTYTAGNWNPPYNTIFSNSTDTTLLLSGNVTLDVSSSTYTCKALTFTTMWGPTVMVIDGDTIPNPSNPYSNSNYTMSVSNSSYTVSGNFNSITLYSPNLEISDICLENCATSSSPCLDLNSNTLTDSPNNYNNDSLYPIGSPFLTAGDIQVIKTKTGAWMPNFEQSTINQINANDILYHGYITFDVSTSNYSCKELTILGIAGQIIIGNDTIATTSGFNPYNGNGYVIDTVSGGYKISGSFNAVTLYSPTSIYSSVCLEDCSINTSSCIDFQDTTINMVIPQNQANYGAAWYINNGISFRSKYFDFLQFGNLPGDVNIDDHIIAGYNNGNPNYVGNIFYQGNAITQIDFSGLAINPKNIEFDVNYILDSTANNPYHINGQPLNNLPAGITYTATPLTNGFHITITGNVNTIEIHGFEVGIDNMCVDSAVTSPCNNYIGFTFTTTPNGVQFTNTSSHTPSTADQFMWDFGDGNTSGNNNPLHNYTAPGTYYVCLTIVDWNCPNPTMHYCDTVVIGGCPNGHRIITPNNDGEADEVFIPAKSKIYDRNGFMVKEITQDMNWKGKDKNNQELPMGYYTITCGNGDGVFNITIVR